jgi:PAS domain S-box-containing protein
MPHRPSLAIRYRLPLLICGLLLGVSSIYAAGAYREVRRASLETANQRLRDVAHQLTELFGASARQLLAQTQTFAELPAVQSFLVAPAPSQADTTVLLASLRTQPATAGHVELWDATGTRRLSTASVPETESSVRQEIIGTVAGLKRVAVGEIRQVRDSLAYPVAATIRREGAVIGYLVQWRWVAATPQARQQLRDLIGSGANLSIGNARGDLWTDMVTRVQAPPVALGHSQATLRYERPTGTQLAAAAPMPGTPWMLLLEFPEAPVLARAQLMLGRFAIVAVIVLLIGVAGAWLLSYRITQPLVELASAATEISRGDYSRRVTVRRRDELGALATAFNGMTQSIAEAHGELEARAEELEQQAIDLSDQALELELSNQQLVESVESAVQARVALENVLREKEQIGAELDASLSSAPVGFAFFDETLRYRRVNERYAELTGAAAAAHVGRQPTDVAPAVGAIAEQAMRKVLETGRAVSDVELSGHQTPGSPVVRHLLASYYPIRTAAGELLGVGSVVTDLTSYKELEQQFLHSQKMEAVGRLAGGVAHDFNNVLTAIASFSQFALEQLPEVSPIREDIEQVQHAARRATDLTRQLLAFSRQQVLQPRVLDLNDTISSVEPMLRRLIGEDIEFTNVLTKDACLVKADPGQIEQVILNLVVNARDAMPSGGSIVIETSHVDLHGDFVLDGHLGSATGRHVAISVSDTGVGMDAATRARIFEPFFSTKEPGRGTGLGLATVYGIVKQSSGGVWVYSEPGKGSTFKVYLPICGEGKSTRTVDPVVPIAASRKAVVLLVEDEAPVRAVARRALEQMGHLVLEAVDGTSALTVLAETSAAIELVITDIVMPGMGGPELVEHLRAMGHEARVLYMSGYSPDAVGRRSLVGGMDGYLEKPFTPNVLRLKVDEVLGVERAPGPHGAAPLSSLRG